jgi:GxxExxY protein
LVGQFFADIIVNQKVGVELKSIESLAKAHEVQLVNYLVATGVPVGFSSTSDQSESKYAEKSVNSPEHPVHPDYPVILSNSD